MALRPNRNKNTAKKKKKKISKGMPRNQVRLGWNFYFMDFLLFTLTFMLVYNFWLLSYEHEHKWIITIGVVFAVSFFSATVVMASLGYWRNILKLKRLVLRIFQSTIHGVIIYHDVAGLIYEGSDILGLLLMIVGLKILAQIIAYFLTEAVV